MKNSPPQIPWITDTQPLPNASTARAAGEELAGLVAAGGGLSVERLHGAYCQGIFPWFSDGQPILWWSPNPRMVLKPDAFKLHRSLKKTIRSFINEPACQIRVDSAFEQVITHCAQVSRGGKFGSWIVPEMVKAYVHLHHAGFAHSIETWVNGRLVGGLYCVAIGKSVFGESMFALQTDASKIALAALVAITKSQHVPWIDCQQNTRHLASLGAQEIDRTEFLKGVTLSCAATPIVWQIEAINWHNLFSPTNQVE